MIYSINEVRRHCRHVCKLIFKISDELSIGLMKRIEKVAKGRGKMIRLGFLGAMNSPVSIEKFSYRVAFSWISKTKR